MVKKIPAIQLLSIHPIITNRKFKVITSAIVLNFVVNNALAFEVLDASNYKNKPNLEAFGVKPVNLIYAGELWDSGEDRQNVPKVAKLVTKAHDASFRKINTVLDIENWQISGSTALSQSSVAKYLKVFEIFKQNSKNIRVGYYGVSPIRDYWRAVKPVGSREYKSWQAENDLTQPIADTVDILFPSAYVFYTDQEGWKTYAVAQVNEARRLAKGKPVFVFLWPRYHESNKLLGMTYINPEYWRLQLETIYKFADGIVIWDGAKATWDEELPWWKVTKEFLIKHKIQ